MITDYLMTFNDYLMYDVISLIFKIFNHLKV